MVKEGTPPRATGTKRRAVALVLILALAGGLAITGESLWDLIVYQRYYHQDDVKIGWIDISRYPSFRRSRSKFWYPETGRLFQVMRYEGPVGRIHGATLWNPDGTISSQFRDDQFHRSGPWIVNFENPSEPSAPWLEEGFTADEWWELVKPDAPPDWLRKL